MHLAIILVSVVSVVIITTISVATANYKADAVYYGNERDRYQRLYLAVKGMRQADKSREVIRALVTIKELPPVYLFKTTDEILTEAKLYKQYAEGKEIYERYNHHRPR